MKSSVRAFLVVALTAALLVACSKPTETSTPKNSPDSASPPQQTISAPPETVAPAPQPTAARPIPPKKEIVKDKPKPTVSPALPKQAAATAAETAAPAQVQPEITTAPTVKESRPEPRGSTIERVTLPAGTLIPIRMIDSVDSKTDRVGQTFRASVDSDIAIEDQTVVAKGTDARLKLNQVNSAGAVRGQSELELQLDRIVIGQKSYAVVTNVIERTGASEGRKTARDIAIGGAIGAVIGAITGGGKGAAIGAGVGAGSGATVAAITKGEQVVVPSESLLEFRLEKPVIIEVLMPFSD